MAMIVAGAVTGKFVSLLYDKVSKEVKLLANGDDRFRGLQSLLSCLQEPIDYLIRNNDKAGETVVHKWLQDLHKELAKAEDLVIKWPKIKRWNYARRQNTLNRLICITENLERLEKNSQTVSLASNVRNFHRLGTGVDTLGAGVDALGAGVDTLGDRVDRLGEEVKTSVHCLTSEVRSLTTERREVVRATEDALAQRYLATFSENIEEIKRKILGTSGSGPNLEAGSGPSGSLEAGTHVKAQGSFPNEVFGGNEALDKVVAEILRHNCLKCVGLWSMGGAGKTFTAGRVFYDPRIQTYFEGKRIWVTVAKRESYDIMKEIFEKVGGSATRFPTADDVFGVRSALKSQLNRDKLLLVIDDVWEAAQLDFMDLMSEPEEHAHSKRVVILVTTRLKEILDRKHATKIEVSLLSEDASWKLFSRNAFGHAQVPRELRDVSRSVASECKQLPLALKVIGSALAGETNLQRWKNSLQKLKHASVLSKEHEVQLFGRLQLSVENLRDRDESDSRLQHCFYYFAAYPEDEKIDPEELVALWTAEGILGTDPDSPISPESEGYELLMTLIALSMIEVVADNNPGIVKIHDVMRDLARYNLETNFGKGFPKTEKIPACQRLCLYRPGLQLRTFPKDWTLVHEADATTSSSLSVERLSFRSNELRQLPEQFDAPCLRVLLLGGNYTLTSLPGGFFKSFRSLRVLDLQKCLMKEIPDAVCNLTSLVFLSLDLCHFLRHIPASIECLQDLQQLRMSNCNDLTSVPRSLRRLTSLKVLDTKDTPIWDGPESSSENVATLRRQDVVFLKSLRSLSITSSSSSPISEISHLTALQCVSLSCENWEELPENFANLVNLRSIELTCSRPNLPPLDQLQHLEKLLVWSDELESLPDSFARDGAFPSLQTFMVDCPRLKGPLLQPGAMPRIKSFVMCASESMELPASFRALSSLIYLRVSECMSLENLSAFEEPNSFPYLEEINFQSSEPFRTLPAGMLKSAPKLRRMDLRETNVTRNDIPEDLLSKERLEQLELLFGEAP